MSTKSRGELDKVVIVVEDQPVLRASMVRGLSKLPGVEIVDAGTVSDARALVGALDASLLISDLDLPDGSGLELPAEMERLGKRCPIVFVTAFAGRYRGQIPARPDIEVHEKPLNISRLRALVTAHLGRPEAAAVSSPFSVADYVQLAAMGRRSVQLEVRRGKSACGAIIIKAGEIWTASDGSGDGFPAFCRLAFAPNVTIACYAVTEELGERTIHGTTENTLLEAARLLDEGCIRPEEEITLPPSSHERLPALSFDELYDRGVDALLAKDYRAAFLAFLDANRMRPEDRRVLANLQRLRDMGQGEPAT
jgi:DNA-binding NtrC family response regulator